ncbi:MAG: M20/M25/M40 family metallo-hydrolase [Candidatus Nanohaloarchaea archaeon]|nr:M20/M25/M40 family metallo-hydrolase [Candidatus Nanohaloarchaea archaeon]
MEAEELLREMVSTPSVFPDEQELALRLEELLDGQGFVVDRVPVSEDRFCLVADRGDPDIGFYGHLDTVPVQGDWSHDPFDPVVEDGRLYGLGAFDMHGGTAAALAAAFETQDPVRILLGVDEELYSRGAYALREGGWLDSLDRLIVPEIADTGSGGNWPEIVLGRRGRCVVRIEVIGEPSHGARPDQGVNAITRAVDIVHQIERMDLSTHPELGVESVFVRRIEGGAESLSIPEEAVIEVDAHLVPPATPESFRDRVSGQLPDYATATLGERPTPFLPPYVTDRDDVSEIESVIEESIGRLSPGHALSVADENVLGQEVPIVVVGPRGGNAHGADEWVDLDSISSLMSAFTAVIDQDR